MKGRLIWVLAHGTGRRGFGAALLCAMLAGGAAGAPILIANRAPGVGRYHATVDEYGAVVNWAYAPAVEAFQGAGFGPTPVAFAEGLYVFAGTSGRILLTTQADFLGNFGGGAENLTRTILASNAPSDTNGDGIQDYVKSSFAVTGSGLNLQFELWQRVSDGFAPGTAVLTQAYRITNLGAGPASFRLDRQTDADLTFDGDWTSDVVLAGTAGGWKYVGQHEPGNAAQGYTLWSSIAPSAYVGQKQGHVPTGGPPALGFGTDPTSPWNLYGMPATWRNYIPDVGYNLDGTSLSTSGADASVNLEFDLNIPAGQSTWLSFQTTFGGGVTALDPVPEPATMSLLALGGLGLLRRRARARRRV